MLKQFGAEHVYQVEALFVDIHEGNVAMAKGSGLACHTFQQAYAVQAAAANDRDFCSPRAGVLRCYYFWHGIVASLCLKEKKCFTLLFRAYHIAMVRRQGLRNNRQHQKSVAASSMSRTVIAIL